MIINILIKINKYIHIKNYKKYHLPNNYRLKHYIQVIIKIYNMIFMIVIFKKNYLRLIMYLVKNS